jgi:hypothetical protein
MMNSSLRVSQLCMMFKVPVRISSVIAVAMDQNLALQLQVRVNF